jgi:hypothetical protein
METGGNSLDPCDWLLKQFTGGNDNVCRVIESALGGLDKHGGH